MHMKYPDSGKLEPQPPGDDMEVNDENKVPPDFVDGRHARKRRSEGRRSSILKKSPARGPADDVNFTGNVAPSKKTRLSSRRVSFAETFQIKEFVRDYNMLWQDPNTNESDGHEEPAQMDCGLADTTHSGVVVTAADSSQKNTVHISGLDKLLSGPIQIDCPEIAGTEEEDILDEELISSNTMPCLQQLTIPSLELSSTVQDGVEAFEQLFNVPHPFAEQLYQGIYEVTDTVNFSTVVNTGINKIVPSKSDSVRMDDANCTINDTAFMDLTNLNASVDERDHKLSTLNATIVGCVAMDETCCQDGVGETSPSGGALGDTNASGGALGDTNALGGALGDTSASAGALSDTNTLSGALSNSSASGGIGFDVKQFLAKLTAMSTVAMVSDPVDDNDNNVFTSKPVLVNEGVGEVSTNLETACSAIKSGNLVTGNMENTMLNQRDTLSLDENIDDCQNNSEIVRDCDPGLINPGLMDNAMDDLFEQSFLIPSESRGTSTIAAVIVEPVKSCDFITYHESTQIFKDGCPMDETEVIPGALAAGDDGCIYGGLRWAESTHDDVPQLAVNDPRGMSEKITRVNECSTTPRFGDDSNVCREDDDFTKIFISEEVDQTHCLGQIIQTMPTLLENSHEHSSVASHSASVNITESTADASKHQETRDDPGNVTKRQSYDPMEETRCSPTVAGGDDVFLDRHETPVTDTTDCALMLLEENDEHCLHGSSADRTQLFAKGQDMEFTNLNLPSIDVDANKQKLNSVMDSNTDGMLIDREDHATGQCDEDNFDCHSTVARNPNAALVQSIRKKHEAIYDKENIDYMKEASCSAAHLQQTMISAQDIHEEMDGDATCDTIQITKESSPVRERTASGNDMEETECLPLYIKTANPVSGTVDRSVPRKKHVPVYDKENVNHIYTDTSSLLDETRFTSPVPCDVTISYGDRKLGGVSVHDVGYKRNGNTELADIVGNTVVDSTKSTLNESPLLSSKSMKDSDVESHENGMNGSVSCKASDDDEIARSLTDTVCLDVSVDYGRPDGLEDNLKIPTSTDSKSAESKQSVVCIDKSLCPPQKVEPESAVQVQPAVSTTVDKIMLQSNVCNENDVPDANLHIHDKQANRYQTGSTDATCETALPVVNRESSVKTVQGVGVKRPWVRASGVIASRLRNSASATGLACSSTNTFKLMAKLRRVDTIIARTQTQLQNKGDYSTEQWGEEARTSETQSSLGDIYPASHIPADIDPVVDSRSDSDFEQRPRTTRADTDVEKTRCDTHNDLFADSEHIEANSVEGNKYQCCVDPDHDLPLVKDQGDNTEVDQDRRVIPTSCTVNHNTNGAFVDCDMSGIAPLDPTITGVVCDPTTCILPQVILDSHPNSMANVTRVISRGHAPRSFSELSTPAIPASRNTTYITNGPDDALTVGKMDSTSSTLLHADARTQQNQSDIVTPVVSTNVLTSVPKPFVDLPLVSSRGQSFTDFANPLTLSQPGLLEEQPPDPFSFLDESSVAEPVTSSYSGQVKLRSPHHAESMAICTHKLTSSQTTESMASCTHELTSSQTTESMASCTHELTSSKATESMASCTHELTSSQTTESMASCTHELTSSQTSESMAATSTSLKLTSQLPRSAVVSTATSTPLSVSDESQTLFQSESEVSDANIYQMAQSTAINTVESIPASTESDSSVSDAPPSYVASEVSLLVSEWCESNELDAKAEVPVLPQCHAGDVVTSPQVIAGAEGCSGIRRDTTDDDDDIASFTQELGVIHDYFETLQVIMQSDGVSLAWLNEVTVALLTKEKALAALRHDIQAKARILENRPRGKAELDRTLALRTQRCGELQCQVNARRFHVTRLQLIQQCSEAAWTLDKVDTHCVKFLFLYNTLAMDVAFTDRRSIERIDFASTLNRDLSDEYSVLCERLAIEWLQSTNLLHSYPTESHLPELLDHVSVVVTTNLNLSRELQCLSHHYHITVSDNRITVRLVNVQLVRKVVLELVMVTGCYHTHKMHANVLYAFGVVAEDVQSCVTSVVAGPQYLTRVIKSLRTLV